MYKCWTEGQDTGKQEKLLIIIKTPLKTGHLKNLLYLYKSHSSGELCCSQMQRGVVFMFAA
jgi:hypothetical protein